MYRESLRTVLKPAETRLTKRRETLQVKTRMKMQITDNKSMDLLHARLLVTENYFSISFFPFFLFAWFQNEFQGVSRENPATAWEVKRVLLWPLWNCFPHKFLGMTRDGVDGRVSRELVSRLVMPELLIASQRVRNLKSWDFYLLSRDPLRDLWLRFFV